MLSWTQPQDNPEDPSLPYYDLVMTLFSVACFREGTRIATPCGEAPVEEITVGDLVCAQGTRLAPVKWIGHRHIDCRRHPKPDTVWPVHVRAEAFGRHMPKRDLWLSPDHAVFVDGVLIPIKHLVNGCTVTQEQRAEITYYHIELEQHDVLMAEGLPVESYLDTGNRSNFANGCAAVQLHPDFAAWTWEAKGFAPLIVTGPIIAAVRARLLQRAAKLANRSKRRNRQRKSRAA
jgi:hypothetical protein